MSFTSVNWSVKNMQTFGLTRMQLLKIILVILSVLMVFSRALATGISVRPLFFDWLSKILI